MPLLNREAGQKLLEIFNRRNATVIPGGCVPYHAILAQRAGYEAFYVSGGLSHAWLLGQPDSGQLTPFEFAENGGRIARAVNIPVFSDADTGGGNAYNAYRTVKEYIWQGLAGCHIEDTVHPKGVTTKGQGYGGEALHSAARVISIEEAVGKLKAAIAARDELNSDFIIIGRTDGRNAIGGGFDEAIKRGKAYEAAGVDIVMFDGMHTWAECAEAIRSVRVPSFHAGAVFTRGTDTQGNPPPTLEQRAKDGEACYLGVGLGWQQGAQTAWETLIRFKESGVDALQEWRTDLANKSEKYHLPADVIPVTEKMREFPERFLPDRTD